MRKRAQANYLIIDSHVAKYTTVEWYGMLRFAQHDNMDVSTCHAERSEASQAAHA